MNRNDDFARALEAWLRTEAPSRAPDHVLDTALGRVSKESQRRSWMNRLAGETRMTTVLRLAAVAAVIAVAAFVGLELGNLGPEVGEHSTPTAEPSSASVMPSPTASVSTLPSLSPAVGCLGSPPDAAALVAQTDPVACFGNAPLTFDATLGGGGSVDCGPSVEPGWLYCPGAIPLLAVGATSGAPGLFVAIDPASAVSLNWGSGTTVRVTGHFDDPAAQTCRETETIPGESPRLASDVIESCRMRFVLTQAVALEP